MPLYIMANAISINSQTLYHKNDLLYSFLSIYLMRIFYIFIVLCLFAGITKLNWFYCAISSTIIDRSNSNENTNQWWWWWKEDIDSVWLTKNFHWIFDLVQYNTRNGSEQQKCSKKIPDKNGTNELSSFNRSECNYCWAVVVCTSSPSLSFHLSLHLFWRRNIA